MHVGGGEEVSSGAEEAKRLLDNVPEKSTSGLHNGFCDELYCDKDAGGVARRQFSGENYRGNSSERLLMRSREESEVLDYLRYMM